MHTHETTCPKCGEEITFHYEMERADDGKFCATDFPIEKESQCGCEFTDGEKSEITDKAVQEIFDGLNNYEPDYDY